MEFDVQQRGQRRLKRYLTDDSVPIPRTTSWRKKRWYRLLQLVTQTVMSLNTALAANIFFSSITKHDERLIIANGSQNLSTL